jgi:hypothetical protein
MANRLMIPKQSSMPPEVSLDGGILADRSVRATSSAILGLRDQSLHGESMSSVKEFQCEICGITSDNPIHWFVIECGDEKLAVIKWDLAAANSPTARHYCGEAHAQVYISRWFESICMPRKPLTKIS